MVTQRDFDDYVDLMNIRQCWLRIYFACLKATMGL